MNINPVTNIEGKKKITRKEKKQVAIVHELESASPAEACLSILEMSIHKLRKYLNHGKSSNTRKYYPIQFR